MRVSLKRLSLTKAGLILSLIFRGEERSGQEVMFCACFQLEVCMIFMTDTHARFGLSEPRSAVGKYIYIYFCSGGLKTVIDSTNLKPEENTSHEVLNRLLPRS